MKPRSITPPSSLSAFLAAIKKEKLAEVAAGNKADFLFRGQREDLPLLPRLDRLRPKGKRRMIERLLMAEFERQRLPFTEFEPKDDWDRLALAQHHGLPTRLLDWTYSALTALWFCVRFEPKKDHHGILSDGVIWILKSHEDDFIELSDPKESPYSRGKTRIFRPRVVTRRILAQSGVFTCHKPTKKGHFVKLESNAAYSSRLIRMPIPAKLFAGLREDLMASGVSSASLFPDLDGLAAHLERRFFHDAKPSL